MENLYFGIDILVYEVPMPKRLNGFLLEDRGLYCIYVNSEISIEEQKKAIEHEICHLTRDDFCTDEDIEDVERRMS